MITVQQLIVRAVEIKMQKKLISSFVIPLQISILKSCARKNRNGCADSSSNGHHCSQAKSSRLTVSEKNDGSRIKFEAMIVFVLDKKRFSSKKESTLLGVSF